MESVGALIGVLKWMGGVGLTILLGIIGWNVKTMQERIDKTEDAFHKHETESAEKFGRLIMAFETASASMARIERCVESVANDVKEALRK